MFVFLGWLGFFCLHDPSFVKRVSDRIIVW